MSYLDNLQVQEEGLSNNNYYRLAKFNGYVIIPLVAVYVLHVHYIMSQWRTLEVDTQIRKLFIHIQQSPSVCIVWVKCARYS